MLLLSQGNSEILPVSPGCLELQRATRREVYGQGHWKKNQAGLGLFYWRNRWSIRIVKKEVAAWQRTGGNKGAKANWQFTAEDAGIKLRRLYQTIDGW